MKIRFMIPVFALLVLVLSACGGAPQLLNDQFLQDTSLVDGEPCGSPCWRNITPGETEWSAALTQLEDDATLAELRVENGQDTEEIAATFQQVGGVPCCLVYSETGETVDQLLLQVAPEMTLGEVIETHGEPAYVTPTEVSGDQASAALYYPEKQMVVYAFVPGSGSNFEEIGEENQIFAVLYVRASDMENIIKNSTLFNWTGFGSFEEYSARTPDLTPEPTAEGSAEE